MKNYQNFMMFFTFFMFWFSIQFGDIVEDSVAFVLIVSLGILHGANDLLILAKGKNSKMVFLKHLLVYLTIIIACVLIYLFSPFIAILLFILLSSYHFGEEHLGEKIKVNRIFNLIFYLFYGVFLFSILFYVSLTAVNEIMQELTGITFTKIQIANAFSISLSVLLILSIYLYVTKKIKLSVLFKEFFYLCLLSLVFKTSSLILGFAIYFIFWHSIPSLLNQVAFIYGDLTKESVVNYFKKAFIYWMISVFGLLVLYQIIPEVHLFSSIIFVLLFAVTAPHTWVMFKMKN
ncbi:MAG: Brp/Blh family beta-carotene 15,15'-dioxygenase [Polaribacter sp.]|nr:Brp/Blh family beta-carotene 15,15'-dioxygenase [Polaribacter sp.]